MQRVPGRGDDAEAAVLKSISEGHATFSAVVSDRLHCLRTIRQVLSDGNFKVIAIGLVLGPSVVTVSCVMTASL